MTSEQLIAEGRKLQRPCSFLHSHGSGSVAAVWYEWDKEEVESTGRHCWMTVDARCIPGLGPDVTGYLSIFTDEKRCRGGEVEITPTWPKRNGTKLYAHTASVLPPIEVVFMHGSEAVGEWLNFHGWERTDRYSSGFKGADVVDEYERVWQQEYPIYLRTDIYAMLGGWHFPMADDDWHDLMDEQLMVFTLRDSEPWVEAWHTRNGQFRVIQRTT